MAFIIAYGAGMDGDRVEMAGDRITIGRSHECDFTLPDKRVSSRHAQVVLRNGAYWLQDLGTTNGTTVNGRKIVQQKIESGAEFLVGPFRLVFVVGEETMAARREASIQEIRQDLHAKLIAQLNLKRLTIEQMRDNDLRKRAGEVLDRLLEEKSAEIPEGQSSAELKKAVLDSALGLGPLDDLLAEPDVTEIMVNAPDRIYIEKGGKLQLSGRSFFNASAVYTAIERIVGPLGRRIDESNPLVDARLPDGSRVNAIIPPLAIDAPQVTIRKFSKRRMMVEDLVKKGALSSAMADFLRLCVVSARNVVISGGTGTGKTTMLNALAAFIPDGERIVTIEDSAELNLPQEHVARLETRPPNIEGKGEFTIRDLVKNALRMRPDRIVVGECRGGEALDMIQAMNTGHDGSMTTTHANSPSDTIHRLETLVMMAGMDLPLKAIRDNVFSAIHLIVQISRFSDGTRKVVSIAELASIYDGEIQLQDIFVFKREGMEPDGRVRGRHVATGVIPRFVEDLREAGMSVDMSVFVPT